MSIEQFFISLALTGIFFVGVIVGRYWEQLLCYRNIPEDNIIRSNFGRYKVITADEWWGDCTVLRTKRKRRNG